MFAAHIKVLGVPHVARGPDVAQAWPKELIESLSSCYHFRVGRKWSYKGAEIILQ